MERTRCTRNLRGIGEISWGEGGATVQLGYDEFGVVLYRVVAGGCDYDQLPCE